MNKYLNKINKSMIVNSSPFWVDVHEEQGQPCTNGNDSNPHAATPGEVESQLNGPGHSHVSALGDPS